MEVMFWVWLGVIAVTLIIEIVTLELVSIWFTIGAVIPFILSAIGGIRIEIQISVFVVVSALLILFLRKVAQKVLFKNMNEKTNTDSIVGKKFKLLEKTDLENNGSLKINGVVWTAVSEDGNLIEEGTLVEVIRLDGNKLVVRKLNGDEKTKSDTNLNHTEGGEQ